MSDNYKIYVHVNKINGKIYIGQTRQNVKDRWDSGHGYKNCTLFNRAIEKYGWNNFDHIVLFDNLSLSMANIIEEELIKKYDSDNNNYGYNIKKGGNNHEMSELTKKKLRDKKIGKPKSKESIEKLKKHWEMYGHPLLGKHLTEETKKKISNANRGKKRTPDQIQKMKELNQKTFLGKHHTEEAKKKIGVLAKERYSKPENNPFWGKHHTKEAKKKMIEAHKKYVGELHHLYGRKLPEYQIECIRKSHVKKVIQYDKDMNIIFVYESAVEAANRIGCSDSAIGKCCKGVNKTCMGYIFKYMEDVYNEVG